MLVEMPVDMGSKGKADGLTWGWRKVDGLTQGTGRRRMDCGGGGGRRIDTESRGKADGLWEWERKRKKD